MQFSLKSFDRYIFFILFALANQCLELILTSKRCEGLQAINYNTN